MTREETRLRIVDAALKALVAGGYHETSMKDIAEQAGVATGLAHYYFESKEDLLLAALEHGCPLNDLPLDQLSGLEAAAAGFEAEKRGRIWTSEAYKLVFDMAGVAMHDRRVGERIRSFLGNRRQLVTEITERVVKEAPAPPRSSPEAIGAALWGAFLGIALQRLLDPDFNGDAALDALAELALVAVAAGSPAGEESPR